MVQLILLLLALLVLPVLPQLLVLPVLQGLLLVLQPLMCQRLIVKAAPIAARPLPTTQGCKAPILVQLPKGREYMWEEEWWLVVGGLGKW